MILRLRRRSVQSLVNRFLVASYQCKRPAIDFWSQAILPCVGTLGTRGTVSSVMNLNHQRYIRLLCDSMLPGWQAFWTKLCACPGQSHTPHHRARCGGHGLASSKPRNEPHSTCWDWMGIWIQDMDGPASTVSELQHAVPQAWAAVHPRKVRTMMESMPRRVHALLSPLEGFMQGIIGVVTWL